MRRAEVFKEVFNKAKIACLGAGYVGGPTMTVIAQQCPDIDVYVVDLSQEKIDMWCSDHLPIYEPQLDDIVKACRGKNLFFSTDVAKVIRECDIIFVAVNTPTKTYGAGKGVAADLTTIEAAARLIAQHAESSKIIIEKSTVPVKTADAVSCIIEANKKPGLDFYILSNPEFLAEGTAIHDLLNADRVLIGGHDEDAIQVLEDIYARWIPRSRIFRSNIWSAELAKLFANAFLAQRISSINAASALCERTGADIRQVSKAIGMDSRIGPKFLEASVGFGGSCFQKDILNLVYLCESYNLVEPARYWRSVIDMNDWQKRRFSNAILGSMFQTVKGKKLAVLGFAFKKDTSDTRETPALDVCARLLAERAYLHVYDPKVTRDDALQEFEAHGMGKDKFDFEKQFYFAASVEEACENAHAIIVLTEWSEFVTVDYKKLYQDMKKPAFVFDGRNILNHQTLSEIGFSVQSVGVGRNNEKLPFERRDSINNSPRSAQSFGV